MATISTSQDYDSTAARTAGETFTITDGATFTIKTDTRFNTRSATSADGIIGSVTVTSGKLLLDGTSVKLLPFDGGASNVPNIGDTLYQGGGAATGVMLGVYDTDLNQAPTTAGSAMPTTGYIKFRSLSGTWVDNDTIKTTSNAGTTVGVVNGSAVNGWIEVAALNTGQCNISSGAGTFETTAAWFTEIIRSTGGTIGQTDGIATTTYQLPIHYTNTYFGGIEVETSSGSGVYEWWPSAGTNAASNLAADERGKVCWINADGLVKFGEDHTPVSGGMLPESGRKLRIPNIICVNVDAAAYGANMAPSSTLTNRYELIPGVGARVEIDGLIGGWYGSIGQGYGNVDNSCWLDKVLCVSHSAPLNVNGFCVGASTNLTLSFVANFVVQNCYQLSTWNNVVVASGPSTWGRIVEFNNVKGLTVTNFKIQSMVTPRLDGLRVSDMRDVSIDGLTLIGCHVFGGVQKNVTLKNIAYSETIVGVGNSTSNESVVMLDQGTADGLLVDGIAYVTATADAPQPYTAFVQAASAGAYNCKIRNIGTADNPIDLGPTAPSTYATGHVVGVGYSTFNGPWKLDRIYTKESRTGTLNFSSSPVGAAISNVWGDVAETVGGVLTNGYYRGCKGVITTTATIGYHFADAFLTDTTGNIWILPSSKVANEPSNSAYTLTGTAQATGTTMFLPAVDDSVTWTLPYKVRGYTEFAGIAVLESGPTANNFLIEISIDEGATWIVAKSVTGTTDITSSNPDISTSYTTGFSLMVRATAKTASTNTTTNGLKYIKLPMTTTLAIQKASTYALEEIRFTDSRSDGITDASVAWINPGGASVFGFYNGTGSEVTYQNEDGTEKTGTYRSRRAGYTEFNGGWTETTSWYLDTKVYFIAQVIAEAVVTTTNDATFTHVDGTSIALGADKTFKNLYDQAQYYSCLEGQMLYDIPVVSAGGGAYTANVDVIVTGRELRGSGSLAMGSNTLTSDDVFSYTYTGGTFSQPAASPAFSGGTLTLGTKITTGGDFSMTAATIEFGAAGADWNLSSASYSGEITLATTAGQSVTVSMPTPSGFTINNTEPGNITVVSPVVNNYVQATVGVNTRLVLVNVTQANTEIDNAFVASPSTSYSFEITTEADDGDVLDLFYFKEGYAEGRTRFTWGAATQTVAIEQETDPAIQYYRTEESITDYTTLTEFNFYAPDIYIQSDDTDGATSLKRMFIFYNGALTTEDGARYMRGGVTFRSAFDVVINRSVVSMAVDNVSATLGLYFTDESTIRVTTDDGTSWIAPPSAPGSIRYAFGVSPGQIETGVSGLTGPESAQLMGLPSATAIATEVVSGITF